MSDQWIVIPGWERFQHYGDREPVWIKVYLELAHDDLWGSLSLAQRGLLVSLWVEYALAKGQLRTSSMPAAIRQKVDSPTLKALSDAGFVRFRASKPPAHARAHARRSKKKIEEEDAREDAPTDKSNKKPPKNATGWKLVRGSHGTTHVPDPFGTDRPPADAPLLKEMH